MYGIIKRAFTTTYRFAVAHKIIVGATVFVLAWGGYAGRSAIFGGAASASYILGTVQRGTIVVSVSGSGQVAATDQVSLTPKGSGTLTYVASLNGKKVRAGTLLAALDATNEGQAVQDAKLDVEDARITLRKIQGGQTSDIPARENDVVAAYADAFDSITGTYSDLQGIRDAIDDGLHGGGLEAGCASSICEHATDGLLADAQRKFKATDSAYDTAYALYRASDRLSDHDAIARLLDQTSQVTDLLAGSLKAERTLLEAFLSDLGDRSQYAQRIADFDRRQADVDSAVATLSRHAGALRTTSRAITDAERTLADARETGPLDLASQYNTVQRAELSLQKAQTALAERSIRAPFYGIVSGLDAHRGDEVSGSTVLGSIVTDRHIAELKFNEVDIPKLAIGQKATLTFDAIPDLTMTGHMIDVDTLGTTSQGVVTYGTTISFDTQDDRIKPGMTVSAAIIIATKTDVLMVPNGAIKSQAVQIPQGVAAGTARIAASATTLRSQPVQTGLANDTMTEIASGLAQGDIVVIRTVTATSATQAAPAQGAGVRIPGGFGGGLR